MNDQHTITELHRQLAAANAQIAELSARIVAINLGAGLHRPSLGERGEVDPDWSLVTDRFYLGEPGEDYVISGDHSGGYGGSC